jgi:hypothetical protein
MIIELICWERLELFITTIRFMMTQKKENGDTVDDFIDWMKNE